MSRNASHEPRELRRRASALCESAARCFECDAPLTDEVWRIRTCLERALLGHSSPLLPHCGTCARDRIRSQERRRRRLWSRVEVGPVPCEACGRRVYDVEGHRGRYVTCGEDCRRAVYADRQRERRREARGDLERRCDSCGENFTPTRIDARYCSGACRQHAYRIRRARSERSLWAETVHEAPAGNV